MDVIPLLARLGVASGELECGGLPVRSPIDAEIIARLAPHTPAHAAVALDRAQQAFFTWRDVPPPRRGEVVRQYGNLLRRHKADLGELVSIEAGKIRQEGLGEVQEMIDICDFAVGLSRQLHGLTIASERPGHRMMEQWHPAGVVGVVSAFNFPAAVWAWNAALAWVCGDSVVWKPSPRTPLTALACAALFDSLRSEFDELPQGLLEVLVGGNELATLLADDRRVTVLSATGSTAMGKALAPRVAARLGRSILELGGNNAAIVCPSADLTLAERAILFAAAGTAGQRCTSLRRLIVHESIADALLERLRTVWGRVTVGNPLDPATLVGPLIDAAAGAKMDRTLAQARASGGTVQGGEAVGVPGCEGACYRRPALVEMPEQTALVKEETFAPILYVLRYRTLDEAIALHNDVPQGLASSIFTRDLTESERFLSATGSDCGIANVNIGPSGAEIGGAFGGEKDTGGGRESGSDAWKAYMRRATCTINYSGALPLAQGIRFGLADG
ncbi:L-piperidine-6-carboxylate dehydrogenase [Aromatoleum bremense]|uniref:aldehyde dehydrogenase (NAD(+)) n=1 Tax=Aromatoleum bremense TaxID=76115 RepID=A0ABX1NVD4_9RHOO|nr:aldehyde dehydrogenase family protein [Aromatoleum bremense]NMG15979.1 aldehyde dehydrogenase family protein [Aromatoleum bremense]QTQ33729.1 putative aldehyde dehydrogenase [Aromatoleum bremense]